MFLKILIEGLILGLLLYLYCAVGIRNGAVNMVFLYHKDVQEKSVRSGLITEEKIKKNQEHQKQNQNQIYQGSRIE